MVFEGQSFVNCPKDYSVEMKLILWKQIKRSTLKKNNWPIRKGF